MRNQYHLHHERKLPAPLSLVKWAGGDGKNKSQQMPTVESPIADIQRWASCPRKVYFIGIVNRFAKYINDISINTKSK